MTLRLGGDGAITGCTSLENPDLTVSGLTISGSFDAEKVLVASGTAAAPSYTFSGDTDNGLYYAGTNSIGLSTGGTNAILIDSSGKVGIGTTAPKRLLHLNGGSETVKLQITNTSTGSGNDGDGFQIGIATDGTAGIEQRENADLTFATNNTERMRIDSSGRLLLNGGSDVRMELGTNGTTGTNDRNHIRADGDNLKYNTCDNGQHIFEENGSERMRITNAGDVRIGTTAAGAGAGFTTKIAVSGGDTSMFKTAGVGATSAAPLRAWHDATSGNNLLQLFHTDTALNTRGTITYNRSSNLLQYNTTSDARLKTNITDASSALSDLSQVRVRSFDWIEDGHNKVNYGFVAQELNDIAPYAVSEGDHEDEVSIQWGVSNSSMVPLLTKALQEAIAKIETLEQRLSDAGIA